MSSLIANVGLFCTRWAMTSKTSGALQSNPFCCQRPTPPCRGGGRSNESGPRPQPHKLQCSDARCPIGVPRISRWARAPVFGGPQCRGVKATTLTSPPLLAYNGHSPLHLDSPPSCLRCPAPTGKTCVVRDHTTRESPARQRDTGTVNAVAGLRPVPLYTPGT